MRPFDLQKAKAGARLCTREGKPARIICWDAKDIYPIVALVADGQDHQEHPWTYTLQGKYLYGIDSHHRDLMLADDND